MNKNNNNLIRHLVSIGILLCFISALTPTASAGPSSYSNYSHYTWNQYSSSSILDQYKQDPTPTYFNINFSVYDGGITSYNSLSRGTLGGSADFTTGFNLTYSGGSILVANGSVYVNKTASNHMLMNHTFYYWNESFMSEHPDTKVRLAVDYDNPSLFTTIGDTFIVQMYRYRRVFTHSINTDIYFGGRTFDYTYVSGSKPQSNQKMIYDAVIDTTPPIEPPAEAYITWTTWPPDSWKVGNYSTIVIGVPEEYKNFTFEYKTPSTNYTTMPIQKNIIPKTYNYIEGKWYYWFSKAVYHSTYGNYSCRITHPEMETETKTVSVPYFDPDITLPPVVIIPIPDVWVDPPQWNVTIPDKYDNVSWLTNYTVFWDGVGGSTNYTLYATVGLLLTPFEMINDSISTVHEYATTAGGMVAGFEHTSIIIKVGWDIIPDDIQNIFIGAAALGVVIFIYHRRT